MTCRCAERSEQIRKAAAAAVRGDVRTVATSARFVARTLAEDTRSGDLRREAGRRLALLRKGLR